MGAVIPTSRGNPQLSEIAVQEVLPFVGNSAREDGQTTLGIVSSDLARLHEDRNILLTQGGVITFTGTTVEFTEDLVLEINSKVAGGSPTLVNLGSTTRSVSSDGRMIYAIVDRLAGTASVIADAATLPAVDSSNKEIVLIAKRVDAAGPLARLYFRDGSVFTNGDVNRLGSGGGATGIQSLNGLTDATQTFSSSDNSIDIVSASGDHSFSLASTIPGNRDFTGEVTFIGNLKIQDASFKHVIDIANQSSAFTFTIPTANANSDFVLTEGTQTVNTSLNFTDNLKVATNTGLESTAPGSTINVGSSTDTSILNLGTGNSTNTVNIGTGTGTTTINIGGAGDTINIQGTTTTVNTATLEVEDQNITVNLGGTDATANGAGLTVDRTGTSGSLIYDSALISKWALGDLGSESEIITSAGAQTIADAKTFSALITGNLGIDISGASSSIEGNGLAINRSGAEGFLQMEASGTVAGKIFAQSGGGLYMTNNADVRVFEFDNGGTSKITNSSGNTLVLDKPGGASLTLQDAGTQKGLIQANTGVTDGFSFFNGSSISVGGFDASGWTLGLTSASTNKDFRFGAGTTGLATIFGSRDAAFNLGSASFRFGTVFATNGTINTSDKRLKENIKPLSSVIDKFMQLKPSTWTSKYEAYEVGKQGLIAQELEKVFPDLVHTQKDSIEGHQNIKTVSVCGPEMMAILIKTIQELRLEKDALEIRIEALEQI